MSGGSQMMREFYRRNMQQLRKTRFENSFSPRRLKKTDFTEYKGKLNSPRLLHQDKMRLQRQVEKRIERHKKLRLFGLVTGFIVVGSLGYFLVVGISSPFSVKRTEKVSLPNPMREYESRLADGDEFLNMKQWYNAAFEYKRALEIRPNGERANYRLTLATIHLCEEDNRGCNQVSNLLRKLEKIDYDRKKIQGLRLRWEGVQQNL